MSRKILRRRDGEFKRKDNKKRKSVRSSRRGDLERENENNIDMVIKKKRS